MAFQRSVKLRRELLLQLRTADLIHVFKWRNRISINRNCYVTHRLRDGDFWALRGFVTPITKDQRRQISQVRGSPTVPFYARDKTRPPKIRNSISEVISVVVDS